MSTEEEKYAAARGRTIEQNEEIHDRRRRAGESTRIVDEVLREQYERAAVTLTIQENEQVHQDIDNCIA
jgi:hypothetical protein